MKSRIVIAGVNSGSGKTTITSGLMRLFKNAGINVQGFKSGPDYIDPSYHTIATGKFSRNLDTWMLGEELVKELLIKNSKDAELSIIEGVMGLFDGRSGTEEFGSTSHLAKITNTPVILVLDTRSIARSAAAIVYGFMHYDPQLNVKGVILNKVASERHLEILTDAIKPLGIEIVGYVMRDEKLKMPERHLGLIPASEMEGLDSHLDYIAEELSKTIDYKKILDIAKTAGEYNFPEKNVFSEEKKDRYKNFNLKIAYAWDKAFSFYYHDGLDYFRHLGIDLVPVSPLNDEKLPEDISGFIIGGGFPELFIDELGSNNSFVDSVLEYNRKKLPIFAECGGFMYLNENITDFENKKIKMLSLIPGTIEMTKKLVAMGYRQGELTKDCVIGSKGNIITGHEFHYSRFIPNDENKENLSSVNYIESSKEDGFSNENIFASYLHFHFAANLEAAEAFINSCISFKKN
jgi:cobyrinic acid a,c-diamide synthase